MKDRTRKIIVAVLLVIAVCCSGYLIWYYATAAKTKQSYENNEDDNYYLSHTWERVEAADGAIFTQACNSKNFTDFNTVIYGHQMGEGVDTMFHTLDRYLEEGYIEKYELIEDGVFKTI